MLTLLSPAKKLLTIEKPCPDFTSSPVFREQMATLVRLMQSQSTQQIARLMHLSETLAELNYQRYQNFSTAAEYPAVFLFQGDVYKGLMAETWDKHTRTFAQSHLMILSGLYGLLKPLDLIKPYRLEMGTPLTNPSGKNLYDYWRHDIVLELNKHLAAMSDPVLINLASSEYFKAVNQKSLRFPVIHVHFMEQIKNQCRIIGIYAKKARGSMANFIMQHQLEDAQSLREFRELDYRFCKRQSDSNNLVFVRIHKPAMA